MTTETAGSQTEDVAATMVMVVTPPPAVWVWSVVGAAIELA